MSKIDSIYSALFDDEVFVMYGLESVEYEINQLQDAPDAYSLQLQLRRVLQALASIGVFIFMNEISENYHFSPRRRRGPGCAGGSCAAPASAVARQCPQDRESL